MPAAGPSLIRYWGSTLKSPWVVYQFALHLPAANGWRTCLVMSRPPESPAWLKPLLDLGTRIEYLPRPHGNVDVGCIWRVYRLCRRLECGVFHCDNIHTSPLIGAALARVPIRLWSK